MSSAAGTKPTLTTKTAYRPLMVQVLGDLLDKYRNLSGYECAVKLLVNEELLILKKEPTLLKEGNVSTT